MKRSLLQKLYYPFTKSSVTVSVTQKINKYKFEKNKKIKPRTFPQIFCHLLFMYFSVLHSVYNARLLSYACVTQRYLQHERTKQNCTSRVT